MSIFHNGNHATSVQNLHPRAVSKDQYDSPKNISSTPFRIVPFVPIFSDFQLFLAFLAKNGNFLKGVEPMFLEL